MFDPSGKVVLITGGANGIGAAVVREFLNQGAKFVAILDVDEENGRCIEHELASKYGAETVKFIKCDVTNDQDIAAAFDQVKENNNYIDVVVNNAAIANEDTYKKLIEINFISVVAITIKALDLMRKDRGGKGGTIVNISSICGLSLISPTNFIYSATKAAVLQFTTSIGMEGYYRNTGVRTLTQCFSLTDTNMLKNLKSFDPDITNILQEEPDNSQVYTIQTPDVVAKGLIETLKMGNSGSVWLIEQNKNPVDITERVKKAYNIMSEGIYLYM